MSRILAVALCLFATSASAAPVPEKPADLAGNWLGNLEAGAVTLRIAFHITRDANGAYKSTFDSLDQGARGIPFDNSNIAPPKLKLTVTQMGATFEGKLEGDVIVGTWTQGGKSLPLSLERVASIESPRRPQEPKRPFPYREEEISITVAEKPLQPKRAAASIKLAGTLSLPQGKGPFPAVVFITGSGPEDRDETVFDHKPFLVISDALVRRGIATLRLDDRGMGKSGGSTNGATTLDFAEDIKAAVGWLATRAEIDKRAIGLLGHSEGGLIAPIVASQSDLPRFLVLLAGTGMTGKDVLRIQVPAMMRAAGKSKEAIARSIRDNEKLWPIITRELDAAHAEPLIRAALADDPEALKELPPIETLLSPWLRTFLTLDPVPYLQKVRVPVLALNGERDLQVDPKNLAIIEATLKKAGNKDVTAIRLAELNHLFQHAKTGGGDEYARIEETFSPEAVKIIGDWVLKHTAR